MPAAAKTSTASKSPAKTAAKTAAKPAAKTPARTAAAKAPAAGKPAPKDAIALLKADHREVEAIFKKFEKADATAEKVALARQACEALIVHATIEEEIFYPAVKPEIEVDMVNEAVVEHASAKDLIAQIMGMDGSEELFTAKVTVLSELIEHHVEEEEDEMFKQVKQAGVDVKALGSAMLARKQELLAGM